MLLDTREEPATLWVDVRVPLGDCEILAAALCKTASMPSYFDQGAIGDAACLLHALRIRQAAEKVSTAAQAASDAFDQWRD